MVILLKLCSFTHISGWQGSLQTRVFNEDIVIASTDDCTNVYKFDCTQIPLLGYGRKVIIVCYIIYKIHFHLFFISIDWQWGFQGPSRQCCSILHLHDWNGMTAMKQHLWGRPVSIGRQVTVCSYSHIALGKMYSQQSMFALMQT